MILVAHDEMISGYDRLISDPEGVYHVIIDDIDLPVWSRKKMIVPGNPKIDIIYLPPVVYGIPVRMKTCNNHITTVDRDWFISIGKLYSVVD